MADWLVARVMSNLETEITKKLARLDTESYWPKFYEIISDRRTHRKRKIVRPLYPCYLFIKTNLFYFLFDVEGITGIIMEGQSPARSVRLDREITIMQASECEGCVPAPVVELAPKLSVGNRVMILSGILRGHVGTCRELRGSRARVGTNLFGREIPVWHSEADLAVT
jgi:transcription antitermination factor NusG